MKLSKLARWSSYFRMKNRTLQIKREHGGALVETALTMPIFLVLLAGAAEFGMASYASVEVENAALAGAQYGVQSASTSGDTTGIQTAATNDAPNIVLGATTVSHSCICSDGSASTCLSTDCSSSHIETILSVQTQTSFNPGIRVPGLPASFTMYGHAIQKVMQ